MDFALSADQQAICEQIERLCAPFDDHYWFERDHDGAFPLDFVKAMADGGWLGIAMPEAYGGAGLGITEAALMMQTIAASGACLSGASAIHLNLFGPNVVVKFGTEEQRQRFLPPLIRGEQRACFAVTEPNTGLDTTHLKTFARRDGDRYIVHGQKVWTSNAQHAHKMLLIARTTPLEESARPIDGLTLFYCDLDRSRVEVREIEKWAASAWTRIRCSSTGSKSRSPTASARKARAFATCCTA